MLTCALVVLQVLQHLAAQGMGDVGGMHGPFLPNIPPQLASLMQVCLALRIACHSLLADS